MDSTYTPPDELTPQIPRIRLKTYMLHLLLFVLTIAATSISGTTWAGKDYTEIMNWHYGLTYSLLLMAFLTAHEFGHYFAARYHKVDASLPYFIPMPVPILSPFGTFGAYIKTRTPIMSRKALFDIGSAGPLAGFVVCFIILCVGFLNLPPKEFLYTIHPEFLLNGGEPIPYGLHFGTTMLYDLTASILAPTNAYLPPMNEMYHYPFLCVGWFGMFVTALNMLPMGQLDGGHVVYAMFGKRQKLISRIFWWILLIIGMGSFVEIIVDSMEIQVLNYAPSSRLLDAIEWIKINGAWYFTGWNGWMFWVIITRFFIKLDHPPIRTGKRKIGTLRMIVGWVTILIFVLSFSFTGIYYKPVPTGKDSSGIMKLIEKTFP
ncbi:MAG: site-2 protease family protein [Ignavibacteria bacterium]|nr:site-2 protease family protein [Ignavibacteria bacterium]